MEGGGRMPFFARSTPCLGIARGVVRECVAVASRTGVELSEEPILERVLKISSGSRHLISTLQDLRNDRPTEIGFLNLAVVAIAEALNPPLAVPNTKLLGELVRLKSLA